MIILDLIVSVLALSCNSYGRVLEYGTPESVGLLSWPFVQLEKNISAYLIPANYSSATCNEIHPIISRSGRDGTIVSHFAVREVVKYANDNDSEFENVKKISAKLDTIYDMASVAVASMVVNIFQEENSVSQLLTHTAGFDADPAPPLWTEYTSYSARRQAIIKQDFTGPLGMTDTFFNRGNLALDTSRIAATDFQIAVQGTSEPQRPQPVWGTVHDENAWSLDGVSGHAGVFSTSMNLGIFCQMILNNGKYGNVRILESQSHGLGFELNQYYFSGPMQSLQTVGHTGFTGTSMVIDRPSNTFMVLLTNRVHPRRTWSSPNIAREMVGYWVKKAMGLGE
ncbi:beta-lactamase/transpeptidase-like protein [Armillaria solidipes]|uniref:Beta-lactamase/transpeptidase-like protein n=1 Tax=Armillaria solidipes TaxID=1076256 RepID=A0A2H3BJD4_9AGAR|nr:beta-lactamase/transpeptidase-like protein [Armillaria solidipes]